MRLQLDTQISHAGNTAVVPASGSGTGADKASTSQDSIQVSKLSVALNRMTSDHAARLQQITDSLADGSYRVSAAAIAGAITGHALTAR